MMEARGTVVPGHSIQFRHTAPTTRGQSGSPLWTVRGGRLILLGIVTHRTADASNIALLAHGTLVRGVVEKWIREDAPRPVERRLAIEVPYRWVCRLEIRDNDVQRVVGYGTGLLISDRHALTSARVIYPFFRDPRRYSVRIVPGYEFGKEVFGSTTASRARVSPGFLPAMKDASQDYGLLTLSRSLGSGTSKLIGNAPLGSWGGASHGLWGATADGLGATVHAASFSRSAGGGSGYHRLRVSSGALVGLRKGQLLHKASTRLDAPGAPIWIEKGGRRLLAGIASSVFSKDSDVNWGCYLDREALSHLMNWVNEDYERKGG